LTEPQDRPGRVLDSAECTGSAGGTGELSFAGSDLVRVGYACQAVITLPAEATAAVSWALKLNGVDLFPIPGGASLGPMTVLNADKLTFTCSAGLVEGADYRASLVGYRLSVSDPAFQFLLPTGIIANTAAAESALGAVSILGQPIGVAVTGQPLDVTEVDAPLAVVIETPPDGMATVGYAFCFHASGGAKPYTWEVTAGSLPVGLSLSSGGHVTGTPTTAGGSTAVVTVTDADANTESEAFGFVVLPLPSSGGIEEITSVDGSITVTDPEGPTVDLSVTGGGGGVTYDAGALPLDAAIYLSDRWQTYLTTAELAVGTWLLTVFADYWLNGSPYIEGVVHVIAGTATATFEGPTVAASGNEAAIETDWILGFSCLVKITAKGTLELQCAGNYRGQLTGQLLGDPPEGGAEPCTGYTAVRISPSAS